MDPLVVTVTVVAALHVPLYALAYLIWRVVRLGAVPAGERRERPQRRESVPPPGPTPAQVKSQGAELARLKG